MEEEEGNNGRQGGEFQRIGKYLGEGEYVEKY